MNRAKKKGEANARCTSNTPLATDQIVEDLWVTNGVAVCGTEAANIGQVYGGGEQEERVAHKSIELNAVVKLYIIM